MRLTLRTLLAYRDNVLSPADREDLHRRIQTSQYGGNLLRGIGEITQRNAVGAPAVLGKGLAADANSVAEYLDDALPHSQVPELERICLDSAVHLAELADCHSLLSTAVRTKVSISAELRRMALGLGDAAQRTAIEQEINTRKQSRRRGKATTADVRADAAHLTSAAQASTTDARPDLPVQVEAPMLASGGESIRPQGLNLETSVLTNEVPEYLIGSPSGQWKFPLAIGALLALLVVLLWQSIGPLDDVIELFAKVPSHGESIQASPRPEGLERNVEADQAPPGVPPSTAAEAARVDAATNAQNGAVTGSGMGSTSGTADELGGLIDVESDAAAPPGLVVPETPPKPSSDARPSATGSDQVGSGEATPPGGRASGEADVTADVTAELLAFSDREPPREPASVDDPSSTQAVWLPGDEQAAEAVLLWREGDIWRRVEAATPLPVGSRWVIPPATRTSIELPGGVHWTACGPSQLELVEVAEPQPNAATPATQPTQASGEPGAELQASNPHVGIAMQLGRALVRGGPAGRDLRLATPVGDFKIQWHNPNSLVSIEVGYRPVSAGAINDPQATKPVLVIVAADESVSVTQLGPAGATHQLSLGDGLACVGQSKPTTFRLQNIPSWYRSSAERPIDKMAAADLHRFTLATAVEEPAQPGGILPLVVELSHSRRPETAALAVQVAVLCGDWEPLVAGFLDDARMRGHWIPTIHLAQQVLAADPATEPQVRTVFSEIYGAAGSELFELLNGSTVDQLAPAALASVVQRLESPQLAFRVLAWYQLQALTGKSLGVQPTAVSRNAIQQWRRELATNRELLLPVGDPIWERIPK